MVKMIRYGLVVNPHRVLGSFSMPYLPAIGQASRLDRRINKRDVTLVLGQSRAAAGENAGILGAATVVMACLSAAEA
jgi:hypothetical protein